jgi:hypothetical protein
MRIKTANKRRKRKLFGATLRASVAARVALCNRFAASEGAYRVTFYTAVNFGVGYDNSYQAASAIREGKPIGYHFKGIFYALKDRLMDRYGKPKGLTLQHWTSYAEGYDYGEGMKDGAHHYHILERVKFGKRILHRPTGHFSFSNNLTDYYKETVGFDEIKKQCVERIEGKKRITRNVPDEREARAALYWLLRRYGKLLMQPATPRPKPRVVTGDYMHDCYVRAAIQREIERNGTDIQCHWCLKIKKGVEMSKIDGHEFCSDCRNIIWQKNEVAGVGSDIPF